MRHGWVACVGGALLVVACAPMTTTVKTDEKIERRHDDIGKPTKTVVDAKVDAGTTELGIVLTERDTCAVRTVEDFHRIRHTDRSVNKPIVVLEYVFGIALGAAGGVALADPAGTSSNISSVAKLDASEVKAAGAGAAGVGGLALLFAIINSTRGGEDTTTLPVEHRDLGPPRDAACGERAIANRPLVLIAGTRTAPLPATDGKGHASASWDALAPALFEGAAPPAKAELHGGDAKGPVLASIDLGAPRKAAIDRAWATVTTARTAAAFKARFPEAHVAEVSAKIIATADTEMDQAVGAAVDANDLAGAHKLLAEWTELVTASDRRNARAQTIAARELEAKIVLLTTGIDAALAVSQDPADLGPLQRAISLSAELGTLAPGDSRTIVEQAKVATARQARQAALLDNARASEKAGKLDDSLKLADLALEALPDNAKADKQRADLKKKVARRYASDARTKAAARDFKAAEEAESRAEAVLPADREVVATRKSLEAQQAAAEAAIADAAERERRKAEREKIEAEQKAAREAERQKQEADKQARADERKRKDDEARAARDAERQRLEAEKQAKADERKQKEDDARAARILADAQKAEAARLEKENAALKKQEAERIAKLEAEKKKAAAIDKAKGDKTKPDKVAKVDPPVAPVRREHARTSEAADARATAAVVGIWAAAGATNAGAVTMIFHAVATGGGMVTILGATNRVLARQTVRWQIVDGSLTIDGGGRTALRGRATLRGDALTWAGYHWQRVRGRTTLTAPAPAAPAAPAPAPAAPAAPGSKLGAEPT
jgi:hypothetical protein